MLIVIIGGVLGGSVSAVVGTALAVLLFFLTASIHDTSLMLFAITLYFAAWASVLLGICGGAIMGAAWWQKRCRKGKKTT
jgi:hypothetical protein